MFQFQFQLWKWDPVDWGQKEKTLGWVERIYAFPPQGFHWIQIYLWKQGDHLLAVFLVLEVFSLFVENLISILWRWIQQRSFANSGVELHLGRWGFSKSGQKIFIVIIMIKLVFKILNRFATFSTWKLGFHNWVTSWLTLVAEDGNHAICDKNKKYFCDTCGWHWLGGADQCDFDFSRSTHGNLSTEQMHTGHLDKHMWAFWWESHILINHICDPKVLDSMIGNKKFSDHKMRSKVAQKLPKKVCKKFLYWRLLSFVFCC